MKKVEAIIKAFKLDDVIEGLSFLEVKGVTITEVRGLGRQHAYKEIYHGSEYHEDFIPKIKIEIVLESDSVQKAVNMIRQKAATGQVGDGKIFIIPVADVLRIRDGEKGRDAI